MKRIFAVLMATCAPFMCAIAQESLPVITLQQSIDAALAKGDSYRILQGNLSVVRAQHEENVSKNSLTLSGSLGAGYNYSFGNQVLAASESTPLGNSTTSPQGAVAGIGIAGPLTTINFSATPVSPPVLLNGTAVSDPLTALGLSASQVLWNGYPGGPTQATVDKSLLNLRGQELSTESGKLNLIYQVKQAYFAMFTALQDLSSKKQVLEKQNALLDQITAIYNLKQASDVDLKTAQINAHSAEIDVQTSEHTLRLGRIRLAILIAFPTDTEFTVEKPPDEQVPAAALGEAISLALSRRVDAKLIELSRKSNAIDLALARGQSNPTVSVGGGVTMYIDDSRTTGSQLVNAGLLNAGVKVAMPVLDAGAAQNLIDASTRLDGVYQAQMTQLQKSIAADVQDAWESMELAREKVDLAQQAAENDDLLVEVYKIQSRNGTASTQDLLTASVNAASAHSAFVQAQAGAQLAVLQLLNVMGY